jgi:hypothetical protein
VPSGGALLANFPRSLDRLSFNLLRGDPGEALASASAGLSPQLDASGAFQQLTITRVRVTPAKSLKQLPVELDLDR